MKRSVFTKEQREHLKKVHKGLASGPPPQPKQIQPTAIPHDGGHASHGRKSTIAVDLTGLTFGRWTVLGMTGRRPTKKGPYGMSVWRCRCECGNVKDSVLYSSLTQGTSRSCGCFKREDLSRRLSTKRKQFPKEYMIWISIKTRCFNSGHVSFKDYGGRGVTMCQEWRESFGRFIEDVGGKPGSEFSLDRINNDGNYEPGNVRWATKRQQAQNTRRNIVMEYEGEMLPLIEIARKTQTEYLTLRARIVSYGMSLAEAIQYCQRRGLSFRERAKPL